MHKSVLERPLLLAFIAALLGRRFNGIDPSSEWNEWQYKYILKVVGARLRSERRGQNCCAVLVDAFSKKQF